ncbi:hypothetical protein Nans01_07670 [Nocardiopsis ansamitocini]|uniref:Uncharacterized protein n=1 Tax=Nocardiopsis ansamitocini TaxID=1670832 RepID=A0A9W6P3I0_9ACTN|nr:hypothetical protein Nans01_07670 [Nocardiopsis ansamitocini]
MCLEWDEQRGVGKTFQAPVSGHRELRFEQGEAVDPGRGAAWDIVKRAGSARPDDPCPGRGTQQWVSP